MGAIEGVDQFVLLLRHLATRRGDGPAAGAWCWRPRSRRWRTRGAGSTRWRGRAPALFAGAPSPTTGGCRRPSTSTTTAPPAWRRFDHSQSRVALLRPARADDVDRFGCSSSLVAVYMACRDLWNRESDLALAAGANVLLDPTGFVAFSRAAIINPEGRCYAFDARAGLRALEGVGVVVLKRLDEALRDGDPVYAVVLNSRVNQDGPEHRLGVPSRRRGELRKVYREAGIDPQRVLFVRRTEPARRSAIPSKRGIGRASRRSSTVAARVGEDQPGTPRCGSGVTG
ncbi:MAG: beta-ketoacyl synthase N-terminal-like domain-containing protein [Candidatus Binatia bacterium]